MQGPADDPGVYQRSLQELFSATAGNGVSQAADISIAMLEIYNEDVRDLLASEPSKALDVCSLGPGQLPPGAFPPLHAHPHRQLWCDVRDLERDIFYQESFYEDLALFCQCHIKRRAQAHGADRFVIHAGVDRIAGLTWRPVTDVADVAAALAHGTEQRATSATAMNATSSRSHAVLSVKIAFTEGSQSSLHLIDLAGDSLLCHASHAWQHVASLLQVKRSAVVQVAFPRTQIAPLELCDLPQLHRIRQEEHWVSANPARDGAHLCSECTMSWRRDAGSERIGRSGVAGQALKEAQCINKSLSALGDVICALQASAKHIPFRNSKLTQVPICAERSGCLLLLRTHC